MTSAPRTERRRAGVTARLLSFVLVAVLAGVTAVVLLLPWTFAAGRAAAAGASALDPLDAVPPSPALPQTSVMLAADGSVITRFYTENRVLVPLGRISQHLQDAVVAVEDNRFFVHGAVDPRGIARAAVNDLRGGSRQGASTLTQQYVKNLLVEQATVAHDPAAASAAVAPTLARKLQELRLAVAVEHRLTKPQILERYLNIVYFGEQTYGAQAAAERYFGVPAVALTIAQAATLAGIVQDPAAFDPVAHPDRARARRDVVLAALLAQHRITAAEYGRAVASRVVVTGHPVQNGCAAAVPADAYFCDYVVRTIATDPRFSALGRTPQARLTSLTDGGLVVRTTLDPATQDAAVRALDDRVPADDPSGAAAAADTVEPGTGHVLAMAQDRRYDVRAGAGRTALNFSVDANLGGANGFQTGSSFKSFTLATWLASGRSSQDVVDATPRAFPFDDFSACGSTLQGSAPYRPGNSEGTETGRMTVARATADSVNVAYVAMESRLDLCDVARTAESLGVHLAAPRQVCSRGAPATTRVPTCLPSLTLGVEDVAPLTMAAAYAGFAAGGTYCPPDPVTAVTRSQGGTAPGGRTAVTVPAVTCRTALPAGVASEVNAVLSTVLTRGTAARVGPLSPWPSAGKTGTTNGPYDTWFVGYTRRLSTAVWVGDPGNGGHARRPLRDVTIGGRTYRTVFGASIAAPIWKEVMTAAQQGLPAEPLP